MRRNVLLYLVLLAVSASAQTAKYPGAVATDQDLLKAVDNAFSQLAAPVPDTTSLALSVNSGASFAGRANFSITVESEQMLICAVSGNTLTVCSGGRGFAGTTAAPHAAGVAVRGNITAWHHNSVAAEVKAIEGALGPNLSNVATSLTFSAPLSKTDTAVSCPTCVTTNSAGPVAIGVTGAAMQTVLSLRNDQGAAAGVGASLNLYGGGATAGIIAGRLEGADTTASYMPFYTRAANAIGEKMRLTSAGVLLLGATADDGSGAKLQVNGAAKAASFIGNLAGNADSVTNGVYTNGSYSDPSWLSISKSKVGLGNVENTALSTWTGSTNVTTIGTLASGTVPWARLSNVPSFESPLTFSPPLSRSTNTIACPTCIVAGSSYSDPSWLTISKSKVGLGSVENTALSTWAGSANITTIGTLSSLTTSGTAKAAMFNANATSATGDRVMDKWTVNDVLRWQVGLDSADTMTFWGYDSSGTYVSAPLQINTTEIAANVKLTVPAGKLNVPKQVNFAIVDPNAAIPASSAAVWTPAYGAITLTAVACRADTADGVIQITDAGTNMLTSNLTCGNGAWASTTSFADSALAQNGTLGYSVISGTAKQYAISIKYTGN